MKTTLFTLLLLAVPVAASAQQPASYTLKVYNQGASAPVQTTTAPASAATCNLAPTAAPAGVVVNPLAAEWDDPASAGKACRLDLAAFFGGLPVDVTQTATLSLTDDRGMTSGESAPSNPFVRAAPPAALRNLRIVGGK